MSALDDLLKLGEFPAVKAYLEWFGDAERQNVLDMQLGHVLAYAALEELAEELVEMSKALDAAISDAKYFERERDELADKLAKSILSSVSVRHGERLHGI